ncbi:hypothetical protein EJD97_021070, partial [Solanum chilense]
DETRRMAARRLEEDRVSEEVLPQVKQVPQDRKGVEGAQVPPQGDHFPNVERGNAVSVVHLDFTNQVIRESLVALDQAVTTQSNLNMVPRVLERIMRSRLRDFVRINPPIFLDSKVREDPQGFLDGVYKVLSTMGGKRRSWHRID